MCKWTGLDQRSRLIVYDRLLAQQDKEVINMTREMRKNFKLTKDEKAKIAVRTAEELELVVKGYMDLAIKQQAGMKTGRDHSVRAERGMTKFLHNFAGYAQAYSGVVQIVKGAGLGYGEAAYGALSLFLVVWLSTLSPKFQTLTYVTDFSQQAEDRRLHRENT